MSVISDATLARRVYKEDVITPYFSQNFRTLPDGRKAISFGQSSFGYDVTLSTKLQLFTNKYGFIIDPKNFAGQNCLEPMDVHIDPSGRYAILPPHSYMLGHTTETFKIPQDLLVLCVGKSTYARCGIHINVTPIEPGFEGQIVLEISNATSLPAKIYIDEGIAQFIFLQGDRPCLTSYADRAGKYQGQSGIQHAKA